MSVEKMLTATSAAPKKGGLLFLHCSSRQVLLLVLHSHSPAALPRREVVDLEAATLSTVPYVSSADCCATSGYEHEQNKTKILKI